MLNGLKNKFIIFILLFGTYNILEPVLTDSKYDPNNKVLLAVAVVAFFWFLILKKIHDSAIMGLFGVIGFSFVFLMFEGGFSLPYYTKWILFVISLLFYYIMLKNDDLIADNNYKLLYLSVLLQIVFFTIESLNSSAYTTMESGTYLVLCFDNKNATAMHLLTLCCILILYAERVKLRVGKYNAIIPLIAFAVCLYFMVLTGSRSSLVGALFIIPFYFLPKLKAHFTKKAALFFVLMPFLFACVYIVLYKAGYSDLSFLGRTIFNGRENLWLPVFEGSLSEWLFGMSGKFIRPDGIPFQLHNGVIDLIATYGIIITAAFLLMIYKLLVSLLDSHSSINKMVVICICALILQSIGEAALFNGTRVIYICMILMFIERGKQDGDRRINQTATRKRIQHSA